MHRGAGFASGPSLEVAVDLTVGKFGMRWEGPMCWEIDRVGPIHLEMHGLQLAGVAR